jgi:ketosteroid isomerase-like protein
MLSTEDAVREHIRAVLAGEMEAIIDGYADDAVLLMGADPLVGKAAIRALFESIPEGGAPGVSVDQIVSRQDYALVTYRGPGMRGGDTFVVRDGKILMQSAHIVAE